MNIDSKTKEILESLKSKKVGVFCDDSNLYHSYLKYGWRRGDSDLWELKNYVVRDKRKNIIFWAFEKNMAWELKYCWHLYLEDYREEFLEKFEVSKYK